MSLEVKLASNKDLHSFFQLFSNSLKSQFPEYSKNTIAYFLEEGYSRNKIKKEIKEGSKQLFLAIINDKTIAYLLATPPLGGVSFCEWIAVDHRHQRRGIALALLEKWGKQVLKDGGHKLLLWTDERNLNFYRNRGFVLVGKIKDNFFGADDYLFIKTLRPSNESNFLKDYLRHKKK